jgi:arylsulfatase A-like enzyme
MKQPQAPNKSPVGILIYICILICSASIEARPPNIVVILTDDQGWGDLSINGNKNLDTPNIDRLANEGITLENFYVCQVCAPTRAEFLTGRYYPRTGVSGVSEGQGRLNYDETTIADVFKEAGYATGAFGKWHNGTQPPYHPNNRGFDEYYGFTSGHWGHYFSPPLDHNGQRVRGKGYVVDDFTSKAIEFIETNKESPFFCYVPYNTPHSPMMISERFYGKFRDADPEMRNRDPKKEDLMMTRAALAMCENIDWNVGRILAKLEELEIDNNTIVIFFSDNGPNSLRWNGDMKGRKGAIDEGGVRSPFFIRWPNEIPAGESIEEISGAIDLLPTLAELARIPANSKYPIDGRSIRPLLMGEAWQWEPRPLFSIKNNQVSVRTQRFRLDNNGQLFDIEADRGQRHNVASKHPEIVKELSAQSRQHLTEMQSEFDKYRDRPFTVGYAKSTTLPARDGIPHGEIKRSSKAPNNSFFTHWERTDDSITWTVDIGETKVYEAILHYTCVSGNEGSTIKLSSTNGGATQTNILEAFDPPLYDKSIERMAESHYFVKDFKAISLGPISLNRGPATLSLHATQIPGNAAIDVHSIDLIQLD